MAKNTNDLEYVDVGFDDELETDNMTSEEEIGIKKKSLFGFLKKNNNETTVESDNEMKESEEITDLEEEEDDFEIDDPDDDFDFDINGNMVEQKKSRVSISEDEQSSTLEDDLIREDKIRQKKKKIEEQFKTNAEEDRMIDLYLKYRKKKMQHIAIGAIVTAIILGTGGFIFYKKKMAQQPAPKTPAQTIDIQQEDPYSQENIRRTIDEGILPGYQFLLVGDNKAADIDAENGSVSFTFSNDNRFFGHSSLEEDDFGTYELSVVDEKVVLHIHCSEVDDNYYVTISETSNIVLTDKESGKEYALYR